MESQTMHATLRGLPATLGVALLAAVGPARAQATASHAAAWQPHTVYQLAGGDRRLELPAARWLVSEAWHERAQLPYLAYLPDKARLLLHIDRQMRDNPGPVLLYSDDAGATWSEPYYLHRDAAGHSDGEAGTGLTYLGSGKLTNANMNYTRSSDYGLTWGERTPVPTSADGKPMYEWGPMLVDTDPATGKVIRLVETRYKELAPFGASESLDKEISQGCIRFSTDEGKTWSQEIAVPQWCGVNEVEQVRARNGDIVAACRIDMPMPFKALWHDNYCGLGISISKDNGTTWSPLQRLFHWGRQHQSLVRLENGDLVMSYLVRRGYPNTPDGQHCQYGVEAVVSHDDGATWDLDHRYILYVWQSPVSARDTYVDMAAGCVTSTVALPDGTLFTAVGEGHRLDPTNRTIIPRDITLVKWRLNPNPTGSENEIAAAPYDSDKRNRLNPFPQARAPEGEARKNLAVRQEGANVTASGGSPDPAYLLYDEYLYPVAVSMSTIPGWVQIDWPTPKRIGALDIYPSDPGGFAMPSTECTPLDYQLQYQNNGEWVDLLPPVVAAPRYTDVCKPGQRVDTFVYRHTFAPVSTGAVRVLITRSSDSGKRVTSADKVVVAPENRCTILRGIDVFEAK
jgi:hypothetical protein